MPLELSLVTEEDFPKFVPDLFKTFGGYSAYVNSAYPANMTEEGQKKALNRFLDHLKMDPTLKWCKVVDTELQEIVGVAQWSIIQDQKPPELDMNGPEGTWSNEMEKGYAQAMHRSFMEHRWKLIRDNDLPIICLNIMGVWPRHQYRGAGTLLMSWGLRLADELNALCVLEGSTSGRWMYEQSGFVVERHYIVEAPEKFSDRPVDRLFFMVRPRSKQA